MSSGKLCVHTWRLVGGLRAIDGRDTYLLNNSVWYCCPLQLFVVLLLLLCLYDTCLALLWYRLTAVRKRCCTGGETLLLSFRRTYGRMNFWIVELLHIHAYERRAWMCKCWELYCRYKHFGGERQQRGKQRKYSSSTPGRTYCCTSYFIIHMICTYMYIRKSTKRRPSPPPGVWYNDILWMNTITTWYQVPGGMHYESQAQIY